MKRPHFLSALSQPGQATQTSPSWKHLSFPLSFKSYLSPFLTFHVPSRFTKFRRVTQSGSRWYLLPRQRLTDALIYMMIWWSPLESEYAFVSEMWSQIGDQPIYLHLPLTKDFQISQSCPHRLSDLHQIISVATNLLILTNDARSK